MDYLPLVHRAWVHLRDEGGPILQSGTLGQMIRWMRGQSREDQARFFVSIQHRRELIPYAELERIAARTGSLGTRQPRLDLAA
ncbi:hypothetical protein [Sphingomonas morindae]|uniref:Uncharacterized protein n=1 Tax=Sphingomonas morindae TaxID=1541170 RepID=A0ABY4XDF2_9SPHN|nr:hypothetical protein [Sphingomonas morindae]USI74953.1 hypothetical protein LHA26_17440 [Sphingomonas morindae]